MPIGTVFSIPFPASLGHLAQLQKGASLFTGEGLFTISVDKWAGDLGQVAPALAFAGLLNRRADSPD